jgi:hypothetical protein
MPDAMKRLALVAAAAAALTLAACTDGEGSSPSPQNAPPVTSAAPAIEPSNSAVAANSADMKYTALAAPCPAVNGRAGTRLPSSQDTATAATAQCTYPEQAGQAKVNSSATIAKSGDPDQVTKTLYKSAVDKAHAQKVEGVASKPRSGLGDEAVLVTRFDDHTTELFVRSGNALIQTTATIQPQMDREAELMQLQQQEAVLTELAKSLLGELR